MALVPIKLEKISNTSTDSTLEPKPKYTQETIDLYTDERCRITLLRPNECGKRVTDINKKYIDASTAHRNRYPYIRILLNMKREIANTAKGKYNKRLYYPGVPCHKCLDLIPIYSKCVVKKGGANRKTYHYSCAKSINII